MDNDSARTARSVVGNDNRLAFRSRSFRISLPLVAVLATTVPYAETIGCRRDVNREPAGLDNAQVKKHSVRQLLAEQETGGR